MLPIACTLFPTITEVDKGVLKVFLEVPTVPPSIVEKRACLRRSGSEMARCAAEEGQDKADSSAARDESSQGTQEADLGPKAGSGGMAGRTVEPFSALLYFSAPKRLIALGFPLTTNQKGFDHCEIPELGSGQNSHSAELGLKM